MSKTSFSRRLSISAGGLDVQLPIAAVTRVNFNPNLEACALRPSMPMLEEVTLLTILLGGAALIRNVSAARSSICW